MGAQLSAYSRQSRSVGDRGGHPDCRPVRHAGSASQTGVDVGADRPRISLRYRSGRLRNAGATGRDVDDFRRRIRHVSDCVDRLQFDHAVPPCGRYRKIRNHQELDRRPHRRSPAAGHVHRIFVRRVHRRCRRIRRARGGFRRDAGRSRFQSVLCCRHLPACQHGACGLWIHRHSDTDSRQCHRACRCWR